jgi:hypothetical protein
MRCGVDIAYEEGGYWAQAHCLLIRLQSEAQQTTDREWRILRHTEAQWIKERRFWLQSEERQGRHSQEARALAAPQPAQGQATLPMEERCKLLNLRAQDLNLPSLA